MAENSNNKKTMYIEKEWFSEDEEGPALIASRCDACERVFFPKKKVCLECFDGNLSQVLLSKTGKLHTYSLSVMGPADMGKSYVMGFIDLPEGISASIERNNVIKLSGIDKQKVGLTAASIRKIRPPEPYKGKGIKYAEEYIRRKAGKAGAKQA